MEIVLKDINGKERLYGDYKSIIDCMVQNKYYLRFIEFSGVDFRNEDFSYADFSDADFSGAIFRNANFEGVNFSNVNFSGANFKWSDFRGVNFSGANFCGFNFEGSNFSCANFKDVDFSNACFKWSGFSGVDFSYVNLKGVDVSCFLLYGANCINTYLDHTLLKIQGSRDLFCGYGGMVMIDCQYHSVDDWLEHGAYTNSYSKSEQKEYMEYLKMYSKIWEEERWE